MLISMDAVCHYNLRPQPSLPMTIPAITTYATTILAIGVHYPIFDHNPPALKMLQEIVSDMRDWRADPFLINLGHADGSEGGSGKVSVRHVFRHVEIGTRR